MRNRGMMRQTSPGGSRMRKRRKIIVYIATSVDSYIARPDGDVRWLDRPHPKGSYGMGSFFKTIDTILWGRKTYSKGIEMGMKPRWQGDWFVDSGYGSGIKNYVFSRQSQASAEPEAKFVNEPVKTFAQRLRALPCGRSSSIVKFRNGVSVPVLKICEKPPFE
jgi:dihydrofolate reductase